MFAISRHRSQYDPMDSGPHAILDRLGAPPWSCNSADSSKTRGPKATPHTFENYIIPKARNVDVKDNDTE